MKKYLLMVMMAFVLCTGYQVKAQEVADTTTIASQKDAPVFTKEDKTLKDSLATAKDAVANDEIKDVLDKATTVLDTVPGKGATIAEWIKWATGALTLIALVAGYASGRVHEKTKAKNVSS